MRKVGIINDANCVLCSHMLSALNLRCYMLFVTPILLSSRGAGTHISSATAS
jgi:hypothetical protein